MSAMHQNLWIVGLHRLSICALVWAKHVSSASESLNCRSASSQCLCDCAVYGPWKASLLSDMCLVITLQPCVRSWRPWSRWRHWCNTLHVLAALCSGCCYDCSLPDVVHVTITQYCNCCCLLLLLLLHITVVHVTVTRYCWTDTKHSLCMYMEAQLHQA